jgi:hypothetical protein
LPVSPARHDYALGARLTAMDRTVKLNELETVIGEVDYPATRAAVVDACGDVTLRLADGEASLGAVVERSSVERFDSADDLSSEVFSLLPRRAVGEPFQSDGDA